MPPLDGYRDAVGLTVVARGVNYGTGFEIALKIRELSGLVTEADSIGEKCEAAAPSWQRPLRCHRSLQALLRLASSEP
jgi:hypothetical protein